MSVLSLEEIIGDAGVLANTRSKTNAGEYLTDFIASGDLGREIDLTSGSFAGKTAKQVKMALDNARKKFNEETKKFAIPGGTDVQVRVKEVTEGKGDDKKVVSSQLFVINTKLVAEAQAKASKAA